VAIAQAVGYRADKGVRIGLPIPRTKGSTDSVTPAANELIGVTAGTTWAAIGPRMRKSSNLPKCPHTEAFSAVRFGR
jgi:hypothetical protein